MECSCGCRGEWLVEKRHGSPGYSESACECGASATTTTTAARGAAQVDCAALGEHKLKAGEHDA
jgi:hypothetical protein